ncbi:diguanylate cyclase domain-containing protein [Comamonas sp. NLF-1-9]|uniref:sensor domain-containing diguanylate cyclase n=1 Tax=Comamonas sp. NLF-1-9 TaxID=2853163 RepID=UPI001C44D5AB|nr:diguanylate cyclase [Comamonas sp. NLF-1-9]QXL84698.1 diguanylate cyclase [Comamonas sp. NLF-1-9]
MTPPASEPAAPDESAPLHVWGPGPLVRSLAVLLVAVAVVAGGLSAWLVSRSSEPQALQRILDQDGGEVEMLARMLSSKMELNFKMLAALADGLTPQVLGSTARLRAWLLQARPGGRLFESVAVLRAPEADGLQMQGANVSAIEQLEDAEQALARRAWQEGKPLVSGVLGGRTAQARLVLALPVLGEDGHTQALVTGSLRLQSQNLLPPSLALPERENTRYLVFTHEGVIVSHPDPARVLGLVRDEPELATLFSGKDSAAALAQPGRVVLGDGTVVGWAVVGLPGWTVTRVNHAPSLLKPLMAAEQRLWWLVAAGVALVAVAALLVLWWLMRPLTLLRQRARAVLAGEHPASVPWERQNAARARGEVQDVVRVFARLVQLRRQQQRSALALARQLEAVLEHVPLGIVLTHAQRIELASGQACRLLGSTPGQLVGRDLLQLVADAPAGQSVAERVRADFAAHGRFHGELALTRRDGSTFWAQVQGEPVHLGDLSAGVIWLLEDGSAEREARLQHDWARWHDPLTFLPNQAALVRKLPLLLSDQVAHGAAPAGAPAPEVVGALLHADLDHFTLINELAGHDAGDDVLRYLARMLQSLVRQMGWVARLGGDEFAVVLPGADLERASALAEKLRAAVAQWEPTYHGRSFSLSLSMGLVLLRPGDAVTDVLASADMACYGAKRQGRNRVQLAQSGAAANAA